MNGRVHDAIDEFLRAHAPAPPARVIVAYSGGLDSTVLLHALAEFSSAQHLALRAVHVDHGLQAGSAAWAIHCRQHAERIGVPIDLIQVEVRDVARFGPEGAARRARHAAFAEVLQAGDLLLTAHHADDQAETFLLRALRAAGPEGLAAMRPLREFGSARLGRPLLGLPRNTLLDYAQRHALAWIEDPSNARADADRNFLRLEVLPLIAQRWPQARRALAECARLMRGAAPALHEALDRRLQAARGAMPGRLRIDALDGDLDAAASLVRHWLIGLGLPAAPPRVLDDLLHQLRSAAADRNILVRWPGGELRRYRDELHAMAPLPAALSYTLAWDAPHPLALPDGRRLHIEGPAPPCALQVRTRVGGERLKIADNRPERDVRVLFQEQGIPPWERERLPYVYEGDQLVAIGCGLVDARFGRWLGDHHSRLVLSPSP